MGRIKVKLSQVAETVVLIGFPEGDSLPWLVDDPPRVETAEERLDRLRRLQQQKRDEGQAFNRNRK